MVQRIRTLLGDLATGLRVAFATPNPRRIERVDHPRVFPFGARWAIEFELDGQYQLWYTDSEEQARLFAHNLDLIGAENAELAA